MSRKFVIDTSIARSAGGENATHPTPINCRDFLIAVREKGYFLVLTPDILEEWQKHRAKFTQTWLNSMFARKRVYREPIPEQTTLRQTVLACCQTETIQNAVDKDWRLVEAALASDKTVASLDETMCDYLKDIGQQVIQLQTICWLNPDIHREVVFNWLENGAREREEASFYLRPPQS